MRLHNWESSLTELFAERNEFTYGSWDCFQLARRAIMATANVDIAANFRPYRSRLGYLRQMRAYCGSTSLVVFAERLMADLGFPQVKPGVNFASRGDVVLVDMPAFGVIGLHGRAALLLDESGAIAQFQFHRVIRAWRT